MLNIHFFSIKGNYRNDNQDSVLIGSKIIPDGEIGNIKTHENITLAIADGMGGLSKGAVASRLCLEELKKNSFNSKFDFKNFLLKVSESFHINSPNEKMGTTLSGMVFFKDNIKIFNIGDTRIFQFTHTDEKYILNLITTDHTLAYESYLHNNSTLDSVRHHPRKNLLTSCITSDSRSINKFDYFEIPSKHGDIFLICSDGVWENFDILELENLFNSEDLEAICNVLKDKKYNIARDNQSIILIRTS